MATMRPLVRRAIRTCDNLLLKSPPAWAKTYIIKDECDKALEAKEIDRVVEFDCGTVSPSDTAMSMPDMQNLVIQVVRDGRLPNYYDEPESRGVIIMGEVMLLGIESSKGFQKLYTREELGGVGKRFRIPPGWVFIADGNRQKDRSGAMEQSRAIMSRFTTYEFDVFDIEYGVEAIKNGYHPVIAAYLLKYQDKIDNYFDIFENDDRPANDLALIEGKNGAWANLRTWAKVSRLLQDVDNTGIDIMPGEIEARIGSGKAREFDTFRDLLGSLTQVEDIVADPKKARVPDKVDEKFHLMRLLAFSANNETFEPFAQYQQRYPTDLQICFFRLLNERLRKDKGRTASISKIRTTDTYKEWITTPHIKASLSDATD